MRDDISSRADVRISAASSIYSEASAVDDRLDPGLKPRARPGETESVLSDLHDEEDYSRPVLGVSRFMSNNSLKRCLIYFSQVRNVPDGVGKTSA